MKKYLHAILLERFSAITVLFMLLSISNLLAQDDMRYCNDSWNCTANDAGLDSVYLVADASGTPLSNNICATGDSIDAFIRGDIYVTATNRYDIAFYADLYVNGNSVGTVKKFAGDYSSGNYSIDFGAIKWACGDKLELRNIYVFWLQTESKKLGRFHNCSESYTTSKCRGNQGINKTITTPVTGEFEFTACNKGENGVATTFTALPAGGSEEYLYSWDFNGDGTEDSSDSVATYTSYNSSDNVTLTITDANDNSKFAITNEAVYYPDEISITGIVSCSSNTGSIDLTIAGGTPFNSSPSYNFEWKNENGTIISTNEDVSNLVNGVSYTVTVTDSSQCATSKNFLINCCELTVECNPVTPAVQGYENLPAVAVTTAELEAIGITVSDSCGNIQITAATDADPGCEGFVHRTYTITDGTETIECTQTFEILPTDPVITCPEDLVVYTTENSLKSAGTEGIKILRSPESYSSIQLKSGLMLKSAGDVVNGFLTLGGWDSQGVPDYLEPTDDVIGQDFVDDIDNSLPESENLLNTHPEYLASGTETNLQLTKKAEVWVTYITEGAGYKNVLGYFHFPTNNPPTSKTEIEDKIVIFPNSSFEGSDGGLYSGNKVQLKYVNPSSGELQDTFPANTTIGWLLGADGWDGSNPTAGKYIHYSIPGFNVESQSDLQQHNVLLYDDLRKILVLGFEDIRRDDNSCDNDFNDVIFYSTVSPSSAINTTDLASIDRPSCAKEITLDPPTIEDECGIVGDVYHNAPDSFIVGETIVEWTIEDNEGNIIYTCQQSVNVIDDIPPTISGPGDVTVYTDPGTCEATGVNLGFPEFSDDCAVKTLENDGVEPYPLGETTVTWTVTDYAGNEATSVQKVTVLDSVVPTVTCYDITILGCSTDEISGLPFNESETAISLTQLNDDGATATDNCEIETITYSDISSGNNPLIVTRTYTVTDKSGNTGTCTKTITIEDSVTPTASNPTDISVQCAEDVPDPDVSVVTDEKDNHTAQPVVEFVDDVSDNQTCPETITRTYSVTDECGNSIQVTQLIIINDDTDPETECVSNQERILEPDQNSYLTNGNEFDLTLAKDNCGIKTLTNNLNGSSTLDGYSFSTGTTEVTWTVVDECDNQSECSFSVTVYNPSYSIEKRITDIDGEGSESSVNEAGDVISYEIIVTNTGNMNLTGISVSDPLIASNLSGPSESLTEDDILEKNENWTYTGTYTATQDDIDNNGGGDGDIDNTATVSSIELPDDSDDAEANISLNPAMTVVKTSTTTAVDTAGQKVTYFYLVTNTGNETLTGISLSDDNVDAQPTGGAATLVPGATTTFTADYTVTQTDIDAGGNVTNIVAASSTEATTVKDTLDIPVTQRADLTILKTANKTEISAPQKITYEISVENTGNTSLTEVVLTDLFAGGVTYISGDTDNDAEIDIDETWIYSADYDATQADVDAGVDLVNIASVNTNETEPKQDTAATIIADEPGLILTKQGTFIDGNQNGLAEVGEIIEYIFIVENTGNVTLTNVMVSDPKVDVQGGSATIVVGNTDNSTFTGEYILTQTDIDNGKVDNTATATSDESDPDSDDETTILSQGASFTMTKTAEITTDVDNDGLADLNDVVTYSFSVTNTGNLTLSNVEIQDPMYSNSNAVCTIPQLSPGETISDLCSFDYVTTKNDVDNGSIVNTASVTAKDPDDNEVAETDTNPSDNTTTTITDDYPIANPDYATTNEDIPVIIGNGKNDENGDGDQTMNIISNPSFGTAQYNENGTPDDVTDDFIDYQPNPNFYGLDELIYEICDSNGDCDTALVVITITSVDEVPVANADYDETWESVPVEILTGSNDHGDDTPFSVTVIAAPKHGNILMDDNNTPHDLSDDLIEYTPEDGFSGMDELIYQVCDEDNDCDTALVKIKVKAFTNLQCPDNINLEGCDLTAVNAATTGFDYSESAISISLADFENNGGTITGDCEITTITYQDEAVEDGCPGPIATVYRTFTVTDECDSIFSCSQTITVEDNIAPEIQCNPITVELRPNGQYVLNSADIERISRGTTDNCTVDEDIEIEVSPRSFSCINTEIPVYVTVTATDLCGNTSVCRTLVTVTENDPPVANCQDVSVYLNENGQARIFAGAIDNGSSDACGIEIASLDQNSFDCSDIGDNIVTLTVYDPAGNQATCEATVTVIDSIQPSVSCPEDIIIPAEEGVCGATVDFEAITTDNCSGTDVLYSVEPGSVFPIGTTEVTATATDEAGNTAICSFNITVTDNTTPEIVCPDDITVSNDQGECGAIVNFEATATDNCSSTIIYSIEPGSMFPVGTTEVIATATDDAGNTISCNFTVTVNDDEAPIVNCPEDIFVSNDSGECGAIVNFEATATDNCSSAMTYSIEPGSLFPVGITEVTATATDDAGNAVTCSFNVTVNDEEIPEITCGEDTVVTSRKGECEISLDLPQPVIITDNCDFSYSNNFNNTTDASGVYPVGTTTVVWTVSDNAGNTSSCSNEVTVLSAPVAVNDTASTLEDTPVDVVVLKNDMDCSEGLIGSSVKVTKTPANGTVTINSVTGATTYIPNPGFEGTDTYNYEVCNNQGLCDEATVTVVINGTLNSPIAEDDVYSTGDCLAITMIVTTNDSDPDGDSLTIPAVINDVENGTLIQNEDGSFEYTPERGFTGQVTFTYEICDGTENSSLCDQATVAINVFIDTDCDGIIDNDDIDDDNDGILDIDEGFTDFDGDGIPNHLDIDTDNDGILDNIEGQPEGQHIYPVWSDTDGDGWDDAYDPDNSGTYFELADTDLDGTPDFIDLDADDDDTEDNSKEDAVEGFDESGAVNGDPDNIADIIASGFDSDDDGLDDNFDTINGWSNFDNPVGGNAPLPDYDGDGIRDWRDPDDNKPVAGGDNPQTPLCEMLIPNGFSPNGDGYNDYFRIYCFENYPNAQIEIYNRWGNLIYEQEDYGNEDRWGTTDAWWNGRSTHKWTVGKEKLPPGTYFYILNLNDGSEPITGSIFLNR